MGEGQPRFLDQVRDRIRRKHHSIRTEETYVDWIRCFILHHNKRHPRDIGAAEVEAFSDPSRGREAGVGLDAEPGQERDPVPLQEVLGEALPWLEGIESAKRPARLPVVLTHQEVESILTHLSGTVDLMIRLLYVTGMRIMECAPAGEGCRFHARGRSWFGRERAGRIA
jgi:integrase